MDNILGDSLNSKDAKISQFQLDYITETIKIPYRTINQLIEYIIDKYGAVPYEQTDTEKRNLKANVIMLNFPEILEKPYTLPINPTKQQLIDYYKKDTSYMQAMNYPKDLGLVFSSYIIPSTGVIVEMEEKTQYFHCRNDDGKIMNELVLWKGIKQTDIDERSPRFSAYLKMLVEAKENN